MSKIIEHPEKLGVQAAARPRVGTKLGSDMQLLVAKALANRCMKVIVMKQAKRPLDSITARLRTINGQIYRVIRHG